MMVGVLAASLTGHVGEAALFRLLTRPGPQPHPVTFVWDPEPGASGFKIYYGPSTGFYTNVVDVGDCTNTTILTAGTNYFVATAYNDAGESNFSTEVMWDGIILPEHPNRVVNTWIGVADIDLLTGMRVTNQVLYESVTNPGPTDNRFRQVLGISITRSNW